MVNCPSSPAMTTDDIGHEMCHGLTLGRSTDTYFFDAQDGQPWSTSDCVLAVCSCEGLFGFAIAALPFPA